MVCATVHNVRHFDIKIRAMTGQRWLQLKPDLVSRIQCLVDLTHGLQRTLH